MLSISSPIPSIRITPALPEEIRLEPYPPIPSAKLDVENDGYRAKWLSIPPSAVTSLWHSSPSRPADCPPHKELGRDQFISLLKLSRFQRANLGMQRKPDLDKESALNNQRHRRLERRGRFLSIVKEPLCTAATSVFIPEVPHESPTITHCPVSPCGFESKFSTLEAVTEGPVDLAVIDSRTSPERHEQVERSQLVAKRPRTSSEFPRSVLKKSRRIPPLHEIAARQEAVHVLSAKDCPRSWLPNFLKALSLSPGSAGDQIKAFPIRSFTLDDEKLNTVQQVTLLQHPDSRALNVRSRRVFIPRTVKAVTGPILHISHADTARDMVLKRTPPPTGLGHHECSRITIEMKKCSLLVELQHNVGINRAAVSPVAYEICGHILRVLSIAVSIYLMAWAVHLSCYSPTITAAMTRIIQY